MDWLTLVLLLAAPVWARAHRHHCRALTTSIPTPQTADAVTSMQVAQTTQALSAGAATSSTKLATSPPASAPGRAVWLWQSDRIKDDTEVTKFLSFAENREIKTVYTLSDREMGNTVWKNFVGKCNSSGIAVEALIGNSQWILGTGEPSLQSELNWINQYQTSVSESAQFAGIHMDVEPWGLDGWASNKDSYVDSLQSIVAQVASLGKSLNLSVAADLPYWAHNISCPTTGKTLDSWVLDVLDSVTVMTYRNTPSELMDVASVALETGNAAGKPVWLAVETVDAADALLISYFGKSFAKLLTDLDTVDAKAVTHNSFAGVAIHDYDGLVALE